MANSDKDIRVVPNRNKSGLPNIAFTGYNNDPIVLNVLDDNTISFEGSSGQLFSVSNAVTTGTIFSVNDISGIPSFRVDADGTVGIAEFSGNVGIGLQSPQSKLSVGGDINVGAGYTFRVAGTKVLDSSSLGTGVTGSSLTSVGTISSGTWQGTAIGVNYGGTGATNASDARSFLGAATAGTNSDITRLLGVQHLFVTIPTAAAIGITVKAATSQSASMMEFVNSSNSVMSWITKDGTFSHGAYFTHSDGRVPGFSVQRANAAGIVARGFNSANFAAIEVQDNPGALVVGLYPSGLVYGGVLQAYSSTASTNTTTGALIVAGGAAIAGTTNFGRDVRIFSSLASSSPFTGSLVVSGGVGISNNLFVGGGVAFTSSIASTSTATGALVVTGGVGIGGSVFTSTSNASSISGVVLSNGSVTLTGTYTQSNSSTTAFQVRDGSNNPAFVIDTIGDIISLPVAVASTSTSSGSLVVAGGVGIGGTLNARSVYVDNDLMHTPGVGNTFTNSWTSITFPSGFSASRIIYAENKFVAIGGSVVVYSSDLINWTTSYIPWTGALSCQAIAYGNGFFAVMPSQSAYVAYSSDLITWGIGSVTYQNYGSITYGNGKFIANSGAVVGISTNGTNWGSFTPSGNIGGGTISYHNGYFYTPSARSVDGINWESLNIPITIPQMQYGNGLYFGAQYNSANYTYSTDGLNFTLATIENNVYVGAEYHNGVYYLRTQHNVARLYYSFDGKNYQFVNTPGGINIYGMAFGKNKIAIVGATGAGSPYAYYAEGTNGKIDLNPIREGNIDNAVIGKRVPRPASFTDLSATGYVNIVNQAGSASTTTGALVVKGGVGIGQSVYIGGKLDVSNTINYVATNSGIANTWTRIAIPSPVSISGLTYGNGLYVGVGYSAATSTDGITWTARSLPHNLTTVRYGNNLYVGVNYGSALGATSTDGITWRSMSLPSSANWDGIAYGNGIYVITATYNNNLVAYSYNGFQWTLGSLPIPGGGFFVTTPVIFGGGYFYTGSYSGVYYFTSVDGINWTLRTGLNYVATNTSCYGDGTWLLTGSSASLAYTKDLTNWTYGSHYGWSGSANLGAYTNGTFAIVDFGSLQCTLIYKNLSTVVLSNLPGPSYATTITAGEGKFIAGAGSTVYVTDVASHTYNIFPHNSGEINNVRIGAKFPSAAQFTVLNATSLVSFGATTPSISTSTGALVVRGGVGIGGSLFVGNTLSVASSTASTSTTTGALIVSGGVGVSGSINASDVVRSGQLIAPTFTLSALGSTGALSPSTTYYYKLSSLDYFGNESLPSNEASIALNSSTYAVNIAPNIDQSIYAIKIYRTTTSNSYTNSLVDTYYPFRGAYNASNIPYNYYDRGKSTSSSSPVTVSTANRAVLGSSINSTLGKLNLAGQLLIQSKNASAPSANIGIQLGNYDIAAVKDGLLAYFSSITSATGGTLTAGTRYYYVMTGVDSYGNETFPSKEFPFLADANGAAQLNIGGGDYGILKYRFYRTTNPGNYTNCYIGELPGYIDINYPTQNASPPTSSSANAYVLKSTPAENIPSYIDSLDVRPGMSGAVRKLADNQYNSLSGIVTSGIAGTLAQNTNYFYKVASYDRYGNTSSASSPYLINTGPATSIQITPMGVDWPAGVEGFLVYRSTSKDNFTNVPTFYAYPGTAITDTGNYEFISSAPTYNNYLLGNFGANYYGYANFYVRSLDIANGGNQSSMNFLSGRSPQPTLSAATGGTLTPGDVYYYKVMAFGRGDDYSTPSPAVRFVVGAGGAVRISVSNISITGFRNYNIYRTADLSNWTNSQIARYVSESDFVDIGYPGTSGSPVGHSGLKRGTSAQISDGAITALTARINSFTQDIAAPGGITISGTTGGILTTNTTYYYRIMAVGVSFNEFGQASKQVVYTTTDIQNAISLSWGLVPNATGYRVLRSTTNNAGAGQTYTFVHGTSFVDKGYATSQHVYDPYALYYPGSYGATISANWNRYHLPFLNITNGENPALTVSMLPPTISSTSTGTGGTLENNTNYYYIVEAYDYNGGSSLPSTEVVVNTGANNSVTLTWTEKNGAFYHKVYRSSNSDFTNKQINQTVYTNTFTDINYPTVNTSPRYSSTNGSMYRIGTVNTSGVYHGLFSRSVFQTTPTPQGAYGTDYAIRVAGRPASSIYGALFELGDFLSTGYNGSNLGTYFGLSSATGFTGNFIDLQANSISRFKVDYLGNATIGSTTGSGSTSTGALVISGGVGIGQSLFTSPSYSSSISGAIFSNGSATLSGTFTQNNSSTTAFQVRDGSNNPAFVIDTISDIITLPVAVASTSTGTGSLVVAGGVGIGQSINIGGRVGIGTNLLDATLNIRTSTSATPGIVIQGSTSQSASLFSVNSSVGGSFFEITNSGIVNIKTSTAGDFNSVPLQRWFGDNNSIVGVFQKGGFLYTGYGLGYVDTAGSQTLVHQWVPNGSYYITNWSKRMANGTQIMFSSSAGGDVRIYGDTNGSLTFQSYGTYTNNTMVKLMDPSPGTNQALLGIVTPGGGNTRSQLFSYGNLALNMTVAGQAGTDWDATNLFRANVYTKTKYLGNLAVLAVDDTNRFTVGPYGNTTVALGGTTASTGFIIKAASSQTGNLFEAQSSTGATLTFIDASGNASVGGTLNISGNASIGGTLNVSGSNSYFQNNLYVGNNTQGRLYFSQATLGSAGTTVIPTMAFIGATNSPITLSVLPDNSLSFDGSSGQLFSINNNLSTGWIFSINDISGLPIFRTNADLTVAMGEYGGNVGIGLSNPTFKLQVSGNAGISGTTLISNTTTSTNSTSGALVVSGGVGIGGSLNVTSASTISGVTINSGVITGSLTGTATTATYANQSGYAITSGSSNTSGYATTSGLATTARNIDVVATTSSDLHLITFSPVNGGSGVGLSTTSLIYVQPDIGFLSASYLDALQVDGIYSNITYFSGTAVTANDFYGPLSGTATTATNVNIVSASTNASHPVLFTPASGTASGAALSTESTFVYNPSTDILSVSGLAITSGTASTSTSTGALRVTGGVGIGGSVFTSTSNASSISGVVLSNGAITNTGTITSTGVMTLSNSSTTAFQVRDGSNNARLSVDTIGGIVSVSSSTASTNTSTGALVVSGGVGIGGSINIGGRLNSGPLASPVITLSFGASQKGTLAPSTTYYYVVTALDYADRESLPSAQVSISLNASTTSTALQWSSVPGVKQYKVYRSTTSGVFTNSYIRTWKAPGSGVFNDLGYTASTGTPPSINQAFTNEISYNTSNLSIPGNKLHGLSIPSGSLSVNSTNDAPLTAVEINGDIAFVRQPLQFPSIANYSGTGGSLAANTIYYYRYSFVDMRGIESVASDPISAFFAASTFKVDITPSGNGNGDQVVRFYRSTNIDDWTNTLIAEKLPYETLTDIGYPQLNSSPILTSSSSSISSYISGSLQQTVLTSLMLASGSNTIFYKNNGVPVVAAFASTAAGILTTNTTYYYKAVFFDHLGGSSRYGPEIAINTGSGTAISLSVNIGQNQSAFIYRSTTPGFTSGSRLFTTGTLIDDGSISGSSLLNTDPQNGHEWALGRNGNLLPSSLTIAPPSNGFGLGIAARSPSITTISDGSIAGTLTTGTKYYYRIVGLDAFGQSTSSFQIVNYIAPATGSIFLQFGSSRMGFSSFNVYRSTNTNSFTNTLIGNFRNNYFTDVGFATTSGSPRLGANLAKDIYLKGVNDDNINTGFGVISNGFYTRANVPVINSGYGVGPNSGTLTTNTNYYYKIRVHFWADNTVGEVSDPFKVNTGSNTAVYLQWTPIEGAQHYTLYRSTNPRIFTNAIIINGIKDNYVYDFNHSVATETPTANYNGSNTAIGDTYGSRLSSLLIMGDNQKLRSLFDAPKFSTYPTSATGGTLANNTVFFYTVVARGYIGGTSLASSEIRVDTGSNNAVSLNWVNVNGATGYDVYRSTTINSWTNTLIASNVQSTSFIDINYPATTGTPNRLNAYGVGYAQSLFENNYNILGRSIFGSVNNVDSAYQNFTVRINGNIFRNTSASTLQVGTGFTNGYTFNGSSEGTELAIASGTGFTGSLFDAHSNGSSRFRINFDGSTIIGSSTASTSSTTGALTVTGGAGIAKTSYFGQDVKIQGTTGSASTTTGALTVTGGVGIGQTLFTSSSYASSISGVILNNGAITNTGTITSTGVMSLSNSSTTALSIKDGSNSTKFNVDTIGGVVSVSSSTASTNTLTGALVVGGGLGVSGDLFVCSIPNSRLSVMHSSGDEGGEIFLNKPVTNTTINTGLTIDIYQNRLRFFEAGGSNRGFYLDIPSGGNSVGTNLLGGGSGTVTTLTAGTGISFSTGSTITTTGTIRARRPMVASFCAGYTPAASGADSVVIRLPDSPSDGTTAITYEPQEFHIRVETASATTTTIQLEKYTGTGAFSGTAITSISISGGSTYEAQTSVFAGAGIFLTSGDKLRINFTALSASHANFSVYLELEEV